MATAEQKFPLATGRKHSVPVLEITVGHWSISVQKFSDAEIQG